MTMESSDIGNDHLTDRTANNPISTITFVYDRCPVCDKIGKSLACAECMKENKTGFLVLQQGKLKENQAKLASVALIPKKLQEKLTERQDLINLRKKEKTIIAEKISLLSVQAKLESEIIQCTKQIERLKRLLSNRKEKLQREKVDLTESRKAAGSSQKRISRVQQKKTKLQDYIKNKQNNITISVKKAQSLSNDLQLRKKEHISMLAHYIFPIKEVTQTDSMSSNESGFSQNESEFDKESTLLQEELEEARRLSFVHGRWVDQQLGSSDFVQISVGVDAASAPPDGDYSLYETWLETNHKASSSDPPISGSMSGSADMPGVQQGTQRSVLRISAALCHAAQMLLVIRKILGIHLPHKLHYRTFSNPTISPHSFINSVKLFNSNLLSVCLQQGVDGSTLHPLHTLRNLQILIDKLEKDGERQALCLPSIDILLSMEETLGLADISDDENDEEEDVMDWHLSIESDWEAVQPSETKVATITTPSYTSTNTQSSILTQPAGLVTSAINWATKGWWGQPNE